MLDTQNRYVGDELRLFQFAKNWKSYFRSQLTHHVSGRVLEVGAGIGATSEVLVNKLCTEWTCLEPDRGLAAEIQGKINSGRLPAICRVVNGCISELSSDDRFDTILYIDVLEHIEQDSEELKSAAGRLKSGGRLVILSPAHNWLFSNFDRQVGHFRRYSRKSLLRAIPENGMLLCCCYLDSLGLMASIVNKIVLHQYLPTIEQIQFWDGLIPFSSIVDRLVLHKVGKSILVVWQND